MSAPRRPAPDYTPAQVILIGSVLFALLFLIHLAKRQPPPPLATTPAAATTSTNRAP